MHVVHLAAQPTAGRWAVQPTESADATVAATVGAVDAVDTIDAVLASEPSVSVALGVEAGEAEGNEEAHA